jgi:hypothetical protein
MKVFKLTGGARIGMANATFPFATLHVNTSSLVLNASILGNFTFHPSDITSIEPYVLIPIIGQGLKINHNVSAYNKNVIFWTFKSPSAVIRQIRDTGFFDDNKETSASLKQSDLKSKPISGFPFKRPFIIGFFIIWNLLFLVDIISFISHQNEHFCVGYGIKTALALLSLSAFLSLMSAGFRHFILKEGHDFNSIKSLMIFIGLASLILLVILN